MKQNSQGLSYSNSIWSKFLDWNPQLFREIKGKLKTRNIIIAAAISVITQFVITMTLLGELPKPDPQGELKRQFGHYGTVNGYGGNDMLYTKDMLGNWVINWQLLWFDLFIFLSLVSIFALLIVGTYMLVADTVKEKSRGTLNFIRLSPQSASNILLGKILGVPILLYIAVLLIFPLHLSAGLGAHIPLSLILAFDVVIISSCAFFYSLALLWSLMNFGVSGFKPWLAIGGVGLFLFGCTSALFDTTPLTLDNPLAWIFLFHPGTILSYLFDATYIPQAKFCFLPAENLGELLFYGQALWTKASFGIGFIIFNFSLWTYWCWSILKRRFHNPESTLISKTQSYWITGWLVAFALGFTLQNARHYQMTDSFILLQILLCLFGLGLIAVLSPHRQALHDWARYRHQVNKDGNLLWKELIFGENSPSTVAVAINLTMAIAYITPSIFLLLDHDQELIFWGFVLSAGSILFYAVVAQLILTIKSRKRAVWSVSAILSIIILPPLCLSVAGISLNSAPAIWLFSLIPTLAVEQATTTTIIMVVLGQWLATALVGFQITRKLKQAGASETKRLLS